MYHFITEQIKRTFSNTCYRWRRFGKKLFKPLGHSFKKDKSKLILIGKTFGHLEQSCFLKENYSINKGMPPEINLLNEK